MKNKNIFFFQTQINGIMISFFQIYLNYDKKKCKLYTIKVNWILLYTVWN